METTPPAPAPVHCHPYVQGNLIRIFKSECRVIEEVQISCLSFVDDTLFFFFQDDVNTFTTQFTVYVNFIRFLVSSLFQGHFYFLIFFLLKFL